MKTYPVPACPHCGRKGSGYKHFPGGYIAHEEWAMTMLKTYEQHRCPAPGCHRFTIWRKKVKTSAPA